MRAPSHRRGGHPPTHRVCPPGSARCDELGVGHDQPVSRDMSTFPHYYALPAVLDEQQRLAMAGQVLMRRAYDAACTVTQSHCRHAGQDTSSYPDDDEPAAKARAEAERGRLQQGGDAGT